MKNDTICAPATPPGTGALAVIRVSGPDTVGVVSSVFPRYTKFEPRTAVYGRIVHRGEMLDDVVVVWYKAPASFTGEDAAEITCHGNPLIVSRITSALIDSGARMAEPGEFARRAFLSGKIDLTGAEAINQIITARSSWELSSAIGQMHGSLKREIDSLREALVLLKGDVECSIDFVTEDIEFVSYDTAAEKLRGVRESLAKIRARCALGRKLSRGADLPLVGKPNAGKSSILNLILNSERAIVSDIPGTTRDIIRETIQFGGVHVNLIDTAGIREADSEIERIGIAKSEEAINRAEIVVMVCDAVEGITDEDRAILDLIKGRKAIVLANKIDAAESGAAARIAADTGREVIPFSAVTGEGMPELEREVTRLVAEEFSGAHDSFVAGERIMRLLERAETTAAEVSLNFENRDPYEIAAQSLFYLIDTLGEITGAITPDDVLNAVFSRFCIGK